ncbi:MAG: DUF4163 domain-containing protein [Enhydrobacter sp.]|nr:MAG: DUF4163 domain-containing protein [Enhydrobacter sp.]
MKIALVAFAMLLSFPAFARQGPSFDCARASTAVERAICEDAALGRADRDLAAAYAALGGRLNGAARDHLRQDQLRWIAARNDACAHDTDGIAVCLKNRYGARIANLRAFAEGGYPFIAELALHEAGRLGQVAWSYDIAYPRFDGASANFAAVNARFADRARKAAAEATPKADAGVDREQQWTYEQSFEVVRPSPHAVTVVTGFYGFSGGAHGYGATDCTLVDLRSGEAVGPDGVMDGAWLDEMIRLAGADLKAQFVDKPGFPEALERDNLAKLLAEPDRYCWRAGRLELIFNQYEVGPYAAGPYSVGIPLSILQPLLRSGGPLSR